MKKALFALMLGLLLWLSLTPFATADGADGANGCFILPESVIIIDDEAFLSTAAKEILLPQNLEYIGARAAADMPNLIVVFIPERTRFIADDAFEHAPERMIIGGIAGSYAHRWAVEHGFAFANIDIWHVGSEGGKIEKPGPGNWRSSAAAVEGILGTRLRQLRQQYMENRRMRPQDRAELRVIDYRFP